MMNYRIIQDLEDESAPDFIEVTSESGITVFEANNSNPSFISFLRQLQKENDPYFQAWVEAGNKPSDFWKQEL